VSKGFAGCKARGWCLPLSGPFGTNPVSFGHISGTPIPITERTERWEIFLRKQVRRLTTGMNVIGFGCVGGLT